MQSTPQTNGRCGLSRVYVDINDSDYHNRGRINDVERAWKEFDIMLIDL